MSIRALPLIIIPFIIYNIVVLLGGSATADEILRKPLFELPMMRGAKWVFSAGDLIILIMMVSLFIELLKSTYTSSVSMIDHGLSMLVFVACLVEFLLVPQAATSVFFFIMIACMIDVVAGYSIGIASARKNLNIGSDS